MVSPLPVQTRARLRALQARIAEVAAAGGASASAQLDNGSEQPPASTLSSDEPALAASKRRALPARKAGNMRLPPVLPRRLSFSPPDSLASAHPAAAAVEPVSGMDSAAPAASSFVDIPATADSSETSPTPTAAESTSVPSAPCAVLESTNPAEYDAKTVPLPAAACASELSRSASAPAWPPMLRTMNSPTSATPLVVLLRSHNCSNNALSYTTRHSRH
jgi:hypothetical protein